VNSCNDFSLRLDRYRYRVLADTRQYRYRPILIWVLVPILVVLSFVYLSQKSTLLQRTPVVSSLYHIFAHIPYIHIHIYI